MIQSLLQRCAKGAFYISEVLPSEALYHYTLQAPIVEPMWYFNINLGDDKLSVKQTL